MHCIIHMNGATTMTTTIALWTTVLKFGIMAVAILLFLEPEGTIQYLYEMVKLGGDSHSYTSIVTGSDGKHNDALW